MRSIDRRSALLILVSLLFMGTTFYHHQRVVAGGLSSTSQKRVFGSDKSSALVTLKEMEFMQQHFSTFQDYLGDQKIQLKEVSNTENKSDADPNLVPGRRVDWIKLLEQAASQLDITKMSFEIFPYQKIVGDFPNAEISVGLESIVVTVSLLHDGVLAALLSYLREHAPNEFVVSAIEIERSVSNSDSSDNDQIAAEFTLQWHMIEVNGGRHETQS